jgi:hypothetical protein
MHDFIVNARHGLDVLDQTFAECPFVVQCEAMVLLREQSPKHLHSLFPFFAPFRGIEVAAIFDLDQSVDRKTPETFGGPNQGQIDEFDRNFFITVGHYVNIQTTEHRM